MDTCEPHDHVLYSTDAIPVAPKSLANTANYCQNPLAIFDWCSSFEFALDGITWRILALLARRICIIVKRCPLLLFSQILCDLGVLVFTVVVVVGALSSADICYYYLCSGCNHHKEGFAICLQSLVHH